MKKKCIIFSVLLLLSIRAAGQAPIDSVLRDKLNAKANQVTSKILGVSGSTAGSYGAFDTNDSKVTGNISLLPHEQSMGSPVKSLWTFNVAAGITEGMAALFNKDKISGNVSGGVSYNRISRKITYLLDASQAYVDSLKKSLHPTSVPVSTMTFSWFSLQCKISNRSFYLFDSIATTSLSIISRNYTVYDIGVSFNRYLVSRWKDDGFFYTLGATYSRTDNFSTLTGREITDTYTYGTAPGVRSSEIKYTAYQGNYATGINQLRINGEFIWFITPQPLAAVHLFPEFLLRDKTASVGNVGAGIILPYVSTSSSDKTGKSVLNFEIYMLLKDVTSNAVYKIQSNPFSRGQIGIKLSFPVNFVNL